MFFKWSRLSKQSTWSKRGAVTAEIAGLIFVIKQFSNLPGPIFIRGVDGNNLENNGSPTDPWSRNYFRWKQNQHERRLEYTGGFSKAIIPAITKRISPKLVKWWQLKNWENINSFNYLMAYCRVESPLWRVEKTECDLKWYWPCSYSARTNKVDDGLGRIAFHKYSNVEHEKVTSLTSYKEPNVHAWNVDDPSFTTISVLVQR